MNFAVRKEPFKTIQLWFLLIIPGFVSSTLKFPDNTQAALPSKTCFSCDVNKSKKIRDIPCQ